MDQQHQKNGRRDVAACGNGPGEVAIYGGGLHAAVDIIRALKEEEDMQRMDDNHIPKKLLWTKPDGKRSAVRPKSWWFDSTFADLKTLGGGGKQLETLGTVHK